MNQLLTGLRVVESSAFVAAPLGGMTLAQLGAEVIRFDPIGGGVDHRRWPVTEQDESLYWAGLNKGKRSFAVNLAAPEGRELIARLIAAPGPGGGLYLSNLPVRQGLDYEALKARRADLIMLLIQGNPDGSTAVDYTVNAALGFPYVTGPEGTDGPVNSVIPAWDFTCGLHAALGLLAAERHRRLTGEGQLIKLSLFNVGAALAAALGYTAEVEVNGVERPRLGNAIFGTFGRDFATKDGRRMMVPVVTGRQMEDLARATGLSDEMRAIGAARGLDFRKDADRYEGRAALEALFEPWFAARGYDEAAAVLAEAKILFGPYQRFAELVRDDPRFTTANPMIAEIEQPGIGRYRVPGSPLDFGAFLRQTPAPAPRLGEHTDAILADLLGLSGAEIGRLHDQGIVAGPDGR
ncbi:MAG: CoA transferase [Alphaproteobacteria bacterium]